ncbi:MAG: hypothetical protein DSZ30_03940 [Aquificaceae bacterium]|nr:MAG: hypothetical protein DSZ30_03940 [Aquificaceae bacterium]
MENGRWKLPIRNRGRKATKGRKKFFIPISQGQKKGNEEIITKFKNLAVFLCEGTNYKDSCGGSHSLLEWLPPKVNPRFLMRGC